MNIQVTVNGKVHEKDVEPRQLLVHFLRDDLANVFSGPQFAQLGGIATLREFKNRNEVFDALRDSVLVQQAVKAGSS